MIPHEDDLLKCIILLAHFLSWPVTKEMSIQDMINTANSADLVMTSVLKKKKSSTVCSFYSEGSNTFYFVDHWFVAFENQHLHKSLSNVQSLSVLLQPPRSCTPTLWLELQSQAEGYPLAPEGGCIRGKASSSGFISEFSN